ncbi:hypothetical protein WJX73_000017 [Symbiochloris irregularis]|uniref:Transmembrane protein n=1 Tax=Symbiochloris irregularis TaxID=706552 RepID=A0AAW1PEA5_9CHLO
MGKGGGKYKKTHQKTKGANSDSSQVGSQQSSPDATLQKQEHAAEQNGNGVDPEAATAEQQTADEQRAQVPAAAQAGPDVKQENGDQAAPAKAEAKESALKKRVQRLKDQCRQLTDEVSALKACLEEERELSEAALKDQSALELWAMCSTAASVLFLGVAVFSFSRSR